MYLMRVILPDRPGSLGAVASALGAADADIHAVEIVERGSGYVIDDFMLTIPAATRPDTLVTACTALPDVEVLWVSLYPDGWGLIPDTGLLEEMVGDPAGAEALLADAAPSAFHCTWAIVADRDDRTVEYRSRLAPDLSVIGDCFGDLGVAHVGELPPDWFPGWGVQAIAVAQFRDRHSIVIGRPGPEFRRSELARLRYLALVTGAHDEELAEPREPAPASEAGAR